MFQDWLNFEREEGTFDHFHLALERYNNKVKELQVQLAKEAELAAKKDRKETKKNIKQFKQELKRKDVRNFIQILYI